MNNWRTGGEFCIESHECKLDSPRARLHLSMEPFIQKERSREEIRHLLQIRNFPKRKEFSGKDWGISRALTINPIQNNFNCKRLVLKLAWSPCHIAQSCNQWKWLKRKKNTLQCWPSYSCLSFACLLDLWPWHKKNGVLTLEFPLT